MTTDVSPHPLKAPSPMLSTEPGTVTDVGGLALAVVVVALQLITRKKSTLAVQ